MIKVTIPSINVNESIAIFSTLVVSFFTISVDKGKEHKAPTIDEGVSS